MKAIVYSKFGPPEVLQVREIEAPVPQNNEVLIRIRATTVEKEDPQMRKSRGLNGIFKPKRSILGMELAGEIEAVGESVKQFRAGDQVYGNAGMRLGTYAQYICLAEDAALSVKPVNISFEEAAAVTNGAITAIPFLRDKGKIQSGQKVLINGASGAVGTAAVQIAKHYGAEVTGVCSTTNLELVKSIGADQVIDYTKEDFTSGGQTYDIVFDAVGKSSFSRCAKILNSKGTYLTTVPTLVTMLQLLLTSGTKGRKVRFLAAGLRSADKKRQELEYLRGLIEAGNYKSVIDRTYPMEQIADAHRYVAEGHKKGSVVITID